ncbi:MAG: elongation factor Ts [Actinomycetota bacterium]|nr:elongation factor Ts [Actinomycetota bacterium]
MTYQPDAKDVMRLRQETGAGMMDCKRALAETSGDFEEARDLLRKQGLAEVAKRSGRNATEGGVFAYIHQLDPDLPAKIGVLIELDCETDFVAKTPEFKQLARDLAMHIAAMEPRWISKTDIPDDFLDRERKILMESDRVKGKKPEIVEKILEGSIASILSDKGGALLEQAHIKDESGKKKVAELVSEYAAQVKENIIVRRFARFKVGEEE